MNNKSKKIVSATVELLGVIGDITFGVVGSFVDHDSISRRARSGELIFNRVSRIIERLANSGYIEVHEESGKQSVALTGKGKIKLLESDLRDEVDGKWRLVSFDIPEKLKGSRIKFCRSLRRVGFKAVQKSLWACPLVKADEIELITKELGIQKYVAYIVVDRTDIENHLKLLFK